MKNILPGYEKYTTWVWKIYYLSRLDLLFCPTASHKALSVGIVVKCHVLILGTAEFSNMKKAKLQSELLP
jgi:hypothetical protein